MAQGASRLSRPLLPGLDFDAPPALQEAWPGEPSCTTKPSSYELLHQYPTLDRSSGAEAQAPSPGPLFDRIKAGHDFETEQIAQARPHTAPKQMASVAPEMALEELQKRLSAESQRPPGPRAEPLSLEGARASVRCPRPRTRPGSLEAIPPPLRQPRRPPHEATTARRMNRSPTQTPRPIKPPTPRAAPRRRHRKRLDDVTSPARQRREGEAGDILDAIRTFKHLEHEGRPATPDEQQAALRF